MTGVMTPTWKPAVPKAIGTVRVHSDFVVDTTRLFTTSPRLLLVGVEKAKEKRMWTPTCPWHLPVSFSVAKIKHCHC